MVEVPDYLLERSKERRAALSGEAPAETKEVETDETKTPAVTTPAKLIAPPKTGKVPQPIPAGPPPPPELPTPPEVLASQQRKRIPYWVMPILLFLPIWAFIYVGTLEEPAQSATGIFGEGQQVFAEMSCAICHGATGAGSNAGPSLSNSELLVTFPDDPTGFGIAQQIEWLLKGTDVVGVGRPYGSAEQGRVAGWFGNMPGFADDLTPHQLLAVVLHERAGIGKSATTRTQGLLLEEAMNTGALVLPDSWSANTTTDEILNVLGPILTTP